MAALLSLKRTMVIFIRVNCQEMKNLKIICVAGLAALLTSCYSGNQTHSSRVDKNNQVNLGYGSRNENAVTSSVAAIEVDNPALSLADYLRRVPGIQVRGSGNNVSVMIRLGSNHQVSSEPLFVLDDVPVSTRYQDVVNMVDVNDIKNVTILKDIASANIYGMNGNNGVILIETKRK